LKECGKLLAEHLASSADADTNHHAGGSSAVGWLNQPVEANKVPTHYQLTLLPPQRPNQPAEAEAHMPKKHH
jgi:hypothetical protein